MSHNLVETIIGAIVLSVAGWFLMFAYERTEHSDGAAYELIARFDKIDGLSVGSDVRMSGIKVGRVVKQVLDVETYQAVVYFTMDAGVQLPTDTAAAVASEGLLGGTYLSILPGGMEEYLVGGDEIEETQDAIDLMGLIGSFMYGDRADSADEKK